MKLIKSKFAVLAAAQTGRTNVVGVKMSSFTILDDQVSHAEVGYYEVVENRNGAIGENLYKTIPLTVNGSLPSRPNIKRETIKAADATLLWQAIGGEIPLGANFLSVLSDQLTTATLAKIVIDQNFIKIENGEFAPLEMQDWEIVNDVELITQVDLDRWAAEVN